MKKLLLVRHAKSSWDYPYLNDYDRPLNERGKNDAPEMAKWISDITIPEVISSSGARRAKDTAKAFTAILGSNITINDNLYHADRFELLKAIKNTNDNLSRIMIISHNPGLNDISRYFFPDFTSNIPTSGILGITFDVENWKTVSPLNATLQFFQYPKNLKNSK